MPCHDPDSGLYEERRLRKELDGVTDLLCRTMRWLEINQMEVPSFMKDWWAEHQLRRKGRLLMRLFVVANWTTVQKHFTFSNYSGNDVHVEIRAIRRNKKIGGS